MRSVPLPSKLLANFRRLQTFDKVLGEKSNQIRGETLHYFEGHQDHAADIVTLFSDTFTQSEGAHEGALIAGLVREMMQTTPHEDLAVFSALEDRRMVGCIFLSRLSYAADDREVFILSPVAVAPSFQRQGVGQRLIRYGLDCLRQRGVAYCVTYGDPNFYSRVGFRQIDQKIAPPPLPLSQPEGWLGQSLTGKEQTPFKGSSKCVNALAKQEYW